MLAWQEIEKRIKGLEMEIETEKVKLRYLDKACGHFFGGTEPAHIHHKGYRTQGDPPGTMGVDWQGPISVPAWTEERWRRVCQKCGKIEYTKRTIEEKTNKPVW